MAVSQDGTCRECHTDVGVLTNWDRTTSPRPLPSCSDVSRDGVVECRKEAGITWKKPKKLYSAISLIH